MYAAEAEIRISETDLDVFFSERADELTGIKDIQHQNGQWYSALAVLARKSPDIVTGTRSGTWRRRMEKAREALGLCCRGTKSCVAQDRRNTCEAQEEVEVILNSRVGCSQGGKDDMVLDAFEHGSGNCGPGSGKGCTGFHGRCSQLRQDRASSGRLLSKKRRSESGADGLG